MTASPPAPPPPPPDGPRDTTIGAVASDDELHAFVDGRLPRERYAAAIHALAADPRRLAQVADWSAQRASLKALHAQLDPGPTPSVMRDTLQPGRPQRRGTWALAASVLVALTVGALAGALGMRSSLDPAGADPTRSGPARLASDPPAFVREATVAHVVYTPEKRHPVEVAGSDEAHLVQWLSRRLGQPLRAPDLQAQGWRLLGGRLLPGDPSPRAQFMYEDPSGRRVTLFVTVFAEGAAPAETSFRSVRSDARESFYWVEGRFGYALSAELASTELQALARDVYRQLDR
jgi:anti-sigma factor RsiW